jgi:hypothetical protein
MSHKAPQLPPANPDKPKQTPPPPPPAKENPMSDNRIMADDAIKNAAECYRARTASKDHWFHIVEQKPFHKAECRCDECDAWREVNSYGRDER